MKSSPHDLIEKPSGGGAVKGLGEKFSPDLFTGAGNFSVPIELPPGRNGLAPKLALSYSSTQGNSPFGLGWSISLPGISRKTSKGTPRYDGDDVFILSGEEDLVCVSEEERTYRPRTERGFARIAHHVDSSRGDTWEVRRTDGTVSTYGTPRPVDAPPEWRDPATVADPMRSSRIFEWRLTRTTDSYGNTLEVSYAEDAGTEGLRRWHQTYVSEIRYVNYADGEKTRFLVNVRFVYQDRPDPFSTHRAGFDVRTTRRCERIEIWIDADEPRLVRTVHLTYADGLSSADVAANHASLLAELRVEGHDADASEVLPVLRLRYGDLEPRRRRLLEVTAPAFSPFSLVEGSSDLVDLSGDGLPDLIEIEDGIRYWKNLGGGRFAPPQTMPFAPAGHRLADRGVQLLDADGDGRTDLAVSKGPLRGYYPLTRAGHWDRRVFRAHEHAPDFDYEDPNVKLVDIDGDGVTDAIRAADSFECFFNHPTQGWVETHRVERRGADVFPDVSFTDPRVRWADMTGDGLTDVVLVQSGRIDYWPALGRGRFAPRVTMRGAPRFPIGHDPRRILLGDVDGDGLADLVYVDNGRVFVWINRAGNGWSEPFEIHGTPRMTDAAQVRIVDLLGNGVAGVLWSGVDAGARGAKIYFLELAADHKPYLLVEADNGAGAVTTVEYASSSRFAVEAAREGRPWRTTLPFSVQVVSRVVTSDLISGGSVSTEYRYLHGYWDGAEREFRGFGRVDKIEVENLPEGVADVAPPAPRETRTWFHLGAMLHVEEDTFEADWSREFWPGDPTMFRRSAGPLDGSSAGRDAARALRGRVLRTETYALDGTSREGRPYSVHEESYGVSTIVQASARQRPVHFGFRIARRTTEWERGIEPLTRIEFEGDYDEYGLPRVKLQIAVPRGRDYRRSGASDAEKYLATVERIGYARPGRDGPFIIDRVAHRTTLYVDEGTPVSALELWTDALAGRLATRVIGQTLHYYDGQPFEGLEVGEIGSHGALVRTEVLALTEQLLSAAYGVAPCFLIAGEPAWTPEYPGSFRQLVDRFVAPPPSGAPVAGGYVFHAGDAVRVRGFFGVSLQRRVGPKGLVESDRSPLGHETRFSYDAYELLPSRVEDPQGLVTTARYDYRVLKPSLFADANGNETAYQYTPSGAVRSIAVLGSPSVNEGDTLEVPGTIFEYVFDAFVTDGSPNYVHAFRRCRHARSPGGPAAEVIESRQFFDGFGRLLQTRSSAGAPLDIDGSSAPRPDEAEPLVVVSGWQTFDGGGRVLEKYEPFMATGWRYDPSSDARRGQRVVFEHDALGRPVRSVAPNGAEERWIFGTPSALDRPEEFEPSPWTRFAYDANDNAGRTPDADAEASSYASHYDTPSNEVLDALGRVVERVERAGPDSLSVIQYTFDECGNVSAIRDQAHRLSLVKKYDLQGRCLSAWKLDGGLSTTVYSASGETIEHRNANGALSLEARDALGRRTRVWGRDDAGQETTLRERLVYGDAADSGLPPDVARSRNLLGRLFLHFDEAGLVSYEAYDFKGNQTEKLRTPISDVAVVERDDFRVEWQPSNGSTWDDRASELLDASTFRTSRRFDALGRLDEALYPALSDGTRKRLSCAYDAGGALRRIALDEEVVVSHIGYDAKRRRTSVVYGDPSRPGRCLVTRHEYDDKTGRLVRTRTERFTVTDGEWTPTGEALVDSSYRYDLVGNPRRVVERAPGSGPPSAPDELERLFEYDALYRLSLATGREHVMPLPSPWSPEPRGTDVTRTQRYRERYGYDVVGNLRTLDHRSGDAPGPTLPARRLDVDPATNRLAAVTVGEDVYRYDYDPSGNLVGENVERSFAWDRSGRLRSFKVQAGQAPPSQCVQYLYDASGRRVKKLRRLQGGKVEVTTYVDAVFEERRTILGGAVERTTTLHVLDGHARVATVRLEGSPADSELPPVQLHLSDHLGSSTLVVDPRGEWINREEYTPYGETSFGGFARKRYRFTARERDEESGLSYHGARYYAPWLGRWISCDPAGTVDGLNPFAYARGAPTRHSDVLGLASDDKTSGPPIRTDVCLEHPPPKESSALLAGPAPSAGPRLEAWNGRAEARNDHPGPVLRDAAGAGAERRLEQMTSNPAYAITSQSLVALGTDPKKAHATAEAVGAAVSMVGAVMAARVGGGAPQIKEGRMPDPKLPSQYAGTSPNARGKLGEAFSKEASAKRGETYLGGHVKLQFDVPGAGKINVVADHVVRLPTGELVMIESKFSPAASYTKGQSHVITHVVMSGDAGVTAKVVTPFGDFKRGDTLQIQFQGDVWSRSPTLYGR